ncbi:type I-E CRISPR-associated protein Cse1/CasA [Bifidobacterium samirii]|uniref:Type I-E CRISPR-associated protein Cse1/CasA n=1 Tax=Bifidobacterium samirii TaxID=2306974 RepID=A0A430FE79_9BIFI|nr:type I-E CRISPR-associated protein Cse1/CasA [Bifidobacterium samirii]RSX51081.1 type I-E CRISPR-associated protein Cse1/CasA [Bifidobacterium samirii]
MSNDAVSFNLMDRPWIPVTMLADGSHRELSIMETLASSNRIRSIDGDIPLQRFALSRMLISMLYSIFGDDLSMEEWRTLFDHGVADPEIMDMIRDYCDEWRSRFDLFDDTAPFYQTAGLHTEKHETSGLERLILDVPNGERFFTTRSGSGLRSMRAAEAARWLVTTQAYDASGIKSGAVGDPRVKGGKGYPIGVAWTGHIGGYLVEGANLWQTLMLNYVSRNVFELGEDPQWNDDVPAWEREPSTPQTVDNLDQPVERTGDTSFFHGPATLMTWQSRRILLAHHDETVTGVLICNGDRIKPQNAHHHEMMTGWRRSDSQEKALKRPLVYMPRKHDPSRALWRGLPSLTRGEEATAGDTTIRPYTLKWLDQVCERRTLPVRLHAFGLVYGNNDAVIDASIDDILDLDLAVITSRDPDLGQLLKDAVNAADAGIAALGNLAANIALCEGVPTDSPRRQAEESGYSAFDEAFRRWVRTIGPDSDLAGLRRDWNHQAKRLLLKLGSQLMAHASPRAIVGRTVTDGKDKTKSTYYDAALVDIWFRSRLNTIFDTQERD